MLRFWNISVWQKIGTDRLICLYTTHSPLDDSSSLPISMSNPSSKLRATSVQSCSSLRRKLSGPGINSSVWILPLLICTLISCDWLTYFPRFFISILRQSTTEEVSWLFQLWTECFQLYILVSDITFGFHTWRESFYRPMLDQVSLPYLEQLHRCIQFSLLF